MKLFNLSFSELPLSSKKALMEYHYMKEYKSFEDLEKDYDGVRFTLEHITIEEAKSRWKTHQADWQCEYKDFDEYHKMYVGDGSDIPNHGDSMYPVIEGGEGEWLDDGWHRFHSYVKHKKNIIPVLGFQKNEL